MNLLQRVRKKYQSDGGIALIEVTLRRLWDRILDSVKFRLWEAGYLSVDDIYPASYYQNMDRAEAMADAEQFTSVIMSIYAPDSIIDLGCGIGRFLQPFWEQGVSVYGVDASETAIENTIVPKEHVGVFDLRTVFEPSERADVVLCLEVVEHLPKESADDIAQSIANSAPIAIITAAKPGQGGKHHVNEKPQEYWIDKLNDVGMEFDQSDTQKLSDEISPSDLTWLDENIMVFKDASRV